MLRGIDAAEPLCVVDALGEDYRPRHDANGHVLPAACPFLEESERGILVRRHPLALLEDSPRLWGTWTRLNGVDQRELSLADRARWSAFDLDLWHVAVASEARKRRTQLRARTAAAPEAPPGAASAFQTLRSLGGRR